MGPVRGRQLSNKCAVRMMLIVVCSTEKIESSHEVARNRSAGLGRGMVVTWGGDMMCMAAPGMPGTWGAEMFITVS